jgi:hypothetical protein
VETIHEGVADGFLIGVLVGSSYHYVNGGIQYVYTNVPLVCFSMAVLCGVYAAIEHAMVSARGKEEPVHRGPVCLLLRSCRRCLGRGCDGRHQVPRRSVREAAGVTGG